MGRQEFDTHDLVSRRLVCRLFERDVKEKHHEPSHLTYFIINATKSVAFNNNRLDMKFKDECDPVYTVYL